MKVVCRSIILVIASVVLVSSANAYGASRGKIENLITQIPMQNQLGASSDEVMQPYYSFKFAESVSIKMIEMRFYKDAGMDPQTGLNYNNCQNRYYSWDVDYNFDDYHGWSYPANYTSHTSDTDNFNLCSSYIPTSGESGCQGVFDNITAMRYIFIESYDQQIWYGTCLNAGRKGDKLVARYPNDWYPYAPCIESTNCRYAESYATDVFIMESAYPQQL